MRRVLKWLLWIFLIFMIFAIFRSPEQAADIVVSALEGIAAAFEAVFRFFDAVLVRATGSDDPLG